MLDVPGCIALPKRHAARVGKCSVNGQVKLDRVSRSSGPGWKCNGLSCNTKGYFTFRLHRFNARLVCLRKLLRGLRELGVGSKSSAKLKYEVGIVRMREIRDFPDGICHKINAIGKSGQGVACINPEEFPRNKKSARVQVSLGCYKKYCPRTEIKKLEVELWDLKVKGTNVIGYSQHFQELALLCVRMFPEESDKIERYVGGLPDMIHESVVASKPKTMQEATEIATELMDKRIHTFAERQIENKRKQDNNQQQQPQNKRQNTDKAYAVGTGEKKLYGGCQWVKGGLPRWLVAMWVWGKMGVMGFGV
ncbi:hypothetical protein Tco_0769500 [Tanacetum coccineum]|uniref:Reverse transcriptase domain-containing protein n=1 Tax=Tanacetum coccineum TaxID=301880 RepID=A0ABQ4Z9K3_9ASTR